MKIILILFLAFSFNVHSQSKEELRLVAQEILNRSELKELISYSEQDSCAYKIYLISPIFDSGDSLSFLGKPLLFFDESNGVSCASITLDIKMSGHKFSVNGILNLSGKRVMNCLFGMHLNFKCKVTMRKNKIKIKRFKSEAMYSTAKFA